MLPATERLSQRDVSLLLKRGTSRHSTHFSVRTAPADAGKSRAACVVSKRVARGAVERNRLRRRMYAALATVLPTLPAPQDVMLVAKPGAPLLSFAEISAEIRTLFSK